MHFDDRLATVLRTPVGSVPAARTQFRQLLDLIGSAPRDADSDLLRLACERLGAIAEDIPDTDRAAMIREPGLRLRNRELVSWLAEGSAPVASAAMANARLSEQEWLTLVPTLPIRARGLLRHRADLPPAVKGLLARLGVQDLVLPQPETVEAEIEADDVPPAPGVAIPLKADPSEVEANIIELTPAMEARKARRRDEGEVGDIATLMRRIESYTRSRKEREGHLAVSHDPQLPLGEPDADGPAIAVASFDFECDAGGKIVWVEEYLAPMLIGHYLGRESDRAAMRSDRRVMAAMRMRQPIQGGSVEIEGAPSVSGQWRIDGTPYFTEASGGFAGYRGRMRRLRPIESAALEEPQPDPAADRLRQMLHELRTPVNAIQGFGEIIQQQFLGPAPNEYRALAAAIGVDVARILAGFDELERLAKLETSALALETGESDLRAVVDDLSRRLAGALRPRSADFHLDLPPSPVLVALEKSETQQLIWRVLATIASAMAPGEVCELSLREHDGTAQLAIELPATMEDSENIFATPAGSPRNVISAGLFGSGFSMRLARAEAQAAGGNIDTDGAVLLLSLPLLIHGESGHTLDQNRGERAGNT